MTAVIEGAKSISVRKFGTLNTATEETKLPIGDSPNMSNVWTDEAPGSVQTAKGYILAGTAPSGNPIKFGFNFKKDDGTQVAIISDNATVWTTRDFQTFTSIITGLSSSFQLRACTARGKLWLTNGNDSVRTYNGTVVVALDGTGGTPNVPKGKYITYYHERVWVYNISAKRSSARFTALTDSSGTEITPDDANAWTATNEIKIGDGDGDFGTGMFLYNQKLHFFKPRSIWRMEGIDEFSYFPFKTRAEIGPRILENVTLLDGLMQFVSIGGFYIFNGDITERISDILNPTSGLGNLSVSDIQSPDTNQEFWIQDTTADFNAGTKSSNIDTSLNDIVLKPEDDLSSDFGAGVEKTRILTANEQFSLSKVTTSTPSIESDNFCLNQSVAVSYDQILTGPANLVDGDENTYLNVRSVGGEGTITVTFASSKTINKIVFVGTGSVVVVTPLATMEYFDGSNWNSVGTFLSVLPNHFFTFSPVTATKIRIHSVGLFGSFVLSELRAFGPAYESTGKFVSRTLDLKETPSTLGKLQVDYDTNGGSASFFTQSSADGVAWDAETSVSPGSAIASTPRRYFRWGVNLSSNSDQTDSPVVSKVYGPGLFISQTFDTVSTIFQWKAFQKEDEPAEGSILYFYRTATTTGGLSSKAWTAISPSSDIVSATSDTCVQFKIELSSGTPTREPFVDSVTINWIEGTEGQVRSEQLVHGISWNGRYWTDVSELGEDANNLMLIRGRKTFNSPWQLKRGWSMLALFIFNDSLYGGSSVDSNIYKLDTGYSANGAALDSYFEGGDLIGDDPDFQKSLAQVIVDYELMGENADYDLSVGVSTDRGTTFTEKSINLEGTGRQTKALNMGARARQFRPRFRTNGVDQPWIAHGIDMLYQTTKFR